MSRRVGFFQSQKDWVHEKGKKYVSQKQRSSSVKEEARRERLGASEIKSKAAVV